MLYQSKHDVTIKVQISFTLKYMIYDVYDLQESQNMTFVFVMFLIYRQVKTLIIKDKLNVYSPYRRFRNVKYRFSPSICHKISYNRTRSKYIEVLFTNYGPSLSTVWPFKNKKFQLTWFDFNNVSRNDRLTCYSYHGSLML